MSSSLETVQGNDEFKSPPLFLYLYLTKQFVCYSFWFGRNTRKVAAKLLIRQGAALGKTLRTGLCYETAALALAPLTFAVWPGHEDVGAVDPDGAAIEHDKGEVGAVLEGLALTPEDLGGHLALRVRFCRMNRQ